MRNGTAGRAAVRLGRRFSFEERATSRLKIAHKQKRYEENIDVSDEHFIRGSASCITNSSKNGLVWGGLLSRDSKGPGNALVRETLCEARPLGDDRSLAR